MPRTKCTTAVNLFLAHRYAAVLIILLVGTGPDPRPAWCNTPTLQPPHPPPVCNQAQTRWLKVLLQLPVWKALSYPHQRQYSHGLQTPPGSTDTTQNNQASYFFLMIKIPQVLRLLIDVNWIFLPFPLHCIRFPGQLGLLRFGTDGIAGFSMADWTQRWTKRCSNLRRYQKNNN